MCAEFEEHREFLRVGHESNVEYREVKESKISPKIEIQTRNVSACGLLFRTTHIPPALSSMIWVELDSRMMNVCSEVEKDLLIHKGGILGRVVRLAEGEPGVSYDVGICFLRKKDMDENEIKKLLAG